MIVTVGYYSATRVQLPSTVLYGVSRGGPRRGRSATQKVWYTEPTVIAAARVEVREAFG